MLNFPLQILDYHSCYYPSLLTMTGMKEKDSSMTASSIVKFVFSHYLAQSALRSYLVSMYTVETVLLHIFLPKSMREM